MLKVVKGIAHKIHFEREWGGEGGWGGGGGQELTLVRTWWSLNTVHMSLRTVMNPRSGWHLHNNDDNTQHLHSLSATRLAQSTSHFKTGMDIRISTWNMQSNANSKVQANMHTSRNNYCSRDMKCSDTWIMDTCPDCKSNTKSIITIRVLQFHWLQPVFKLEGWAEKE